MFDNTSVQAAMNAGLNALKTKGTLVLSGIPKQDSPAFSIDIFPMLLQGWRVIATTEGDADPAEFIPTMVDLFMEGRFPIDKMLSFYKLDEINDAVAAHYRGEVVKAILRP